MRRVAFGLIGIAVVAVCPVHHVFGQDAPLPAAAPVITQPVDAATQAQAIANGKLLLAQPVWKQEVATNVSDMKLIGPALVCGGFNHLTVPEPRKGQSLWELDRGLQGALGWADGGLVNLGPIYGGGVQLTRW
jgi:hypothetical protein